MGADVYRASMYVDDNGYLTNPSGFTSTVDSLVDKVGARGMYAIIDRNYYRRFSPDTYFYM